MVARIARAVDLPVTADLEGGYGDAAATAEAAIAAGAVGLNLEDGNGAADEHVARVRAARAAGERLGVPLVVNARVDVFLPGGSGDVGEAVERANAYLAAGADCAYPIGVADPRVVSSSSTGSAAPSTCTRRRRTDRGGAAALGVRRISVGALLHRATLAACAPPPRRRSAPARLGGQRRGDRRRAERAARVACRDRRAALTARGRLRPRRPAARHRGGVDGPSGRSPATASPSGRGEAAFLGTSFENGGRCSSACSTTRPRAELSAELLSSSERMLAGAAPPGGASSSRASGTTPLASPPTRRGFVRAALESPLADAFATVVTADQVPRRSPRRTSTSRRAAGSTRRRRSRWRSRTRLPESRRARGGLYVIGVPSLPASCWTPTSSLLRSPTRPCRRRSRPRRPAAPLPTGRRVRVERDQYSPGVPSEEEMT